MLYIQWVSDCCLTPSEHCLTISWRVHDTFWWDIDVDDVHFVLDQHSETDFYSIRSLKQQSAGRHVAPIRHIILIPSKPVFALTPQWHVVSREAANTNFKLFGLTWTVLDPPIYCTWSEILTITPLMWILWIHILI